MKYALGNMLNGAGGFNPDGLSLDLQFAADKTLTARRGPTPVLTRASTGTFIGSNGLIQSAAVDAARFDHDPITRACRGLLIEESRANLLKYSQEFENIAWTPFASTVSANAAVAPDGTTTADKLIPTVTSSQHYASSTITSAASTYTVTVYAKADGYNWLWFNTVGSGSPATDLCWFDVLNGVTGTAQANATTSIQSMGNGWFRCVCSWSAFTVGTPAIWIAVSTANNQSAAFSGDGTSGILIWGAQIEAGSFATSYIPTGASALTRSADVCSITGSNFTGMYNQAEGSVLVDAFTPALGIRNIVTCFAGFDKQITLLTNVSAAALKVIDGVSQVDMGFGPPIIPNTAFKLACAYKLNDFAITENGIAPQTDTSGTVPTVDAMRVGSGPAGNTMCECISSLRYYRKRLPNAKLQSLTI